MIAQQKAPDANGGGWKDRTTPSLPVLRSHAIPKRSTWPGNHGPSPFFRSDSHYELAMTMAHLRGKVELELVAVTAADPLHGSRLLRECGVTADLFDQEDLRILAQAIDLAGEHGQETTARVARLALRYFGLWDATDTRTFARRPLWSDYSLAGLFTSRFYSPPMVRLYASRLRDVDRRARIATISEHRAIAALTGGIDAFAMNLLGQAVDHG